MIRKICIIIGLLVGILWMSHIDKALSEDSKEQEALQTHIDIVKIKNPQMYQSMVDAAGGNIVNCMSCHHDIFKDTGSSSKRRPQ
jgi:predicted small secreted protein